jgi:hypothetical protein
MSKAVVVNNIAPKARKFRGRVSQYQLSSSESHNAVILRNQSIRIYGVYCGKPYDVTFELGGQAEYDSFNLKYLGKIVGITDKGVTILPRYSGGGTKRLDLYTFCWRNCRFDLDAITAHNAAESQCI